MSRVRAKIEDTGEKTHIQVSNAAHTKRFTSLARTAIELHAAPVDQTIHQSRDVTDVVCITPATTENASSRIEKEFQRLSIPDS